MKLPNTILTPNVIQNNFWDEDNDMEEMDLEPKLSMKERFQLWIAKRNARVKDNLDFARNFMNSISKKVALACCITGLFAISTLFISIIQMPILWKVLLFSLSFVGFEISETKTRKVVNECKKINQMNDSQNKNENAIEKKTNIFTKIKNKLFYKKRNSVSRQENMEENMPEAISEEITEYTDEDTYNNTEEYTDEDTYNNTEEYTDEDTYNDTEEYTDEDTYHDTEEYTEEDAYDDMEEYTEQSKSNHRKITLHPLTRPVKIKSWNVGRVKGLGIYYIAVPIESINAQYFIEDEIQEKMPEESFQVLETETKKVYVLNKKPNIFE